jgi:hypothetical protein
MSTSKKTKGKTIVLKLIITRIQISKQNIIRKFFKLELCFIAELKKEVLDSTIIIYNK